MNTRSHRQKRPRYRTDYYGKVYEWSQDHCAYLYIGELQGRTLEQWKADNEDGFDRMAMQGLFDI